MNQPSTVELYIAHYEDLTTEQGRVNFLVNLKKMGSSDSLDAFQILGKRWLAEPILE